MYVQINLADRILPVYTTGQHMHKPCPILPPNAQEWWLFGGEYKRLVKRRGMWSKDFTYHTNNALPVTIPSTLWWHLANYMNNEKQGETCYFNHLSTWHCSQQTLICYQGLKIIWNHTRSLHVVKITLFHYLVI